ncbi:heterokaryon incompatibility protein-domain-containing protein [Aspergillus pseudotamarii]|uniref:Heterokaryon incompatibility protein-domain-containing protein n=1 Tax=Aspergillus pseudotamarii TaxID=132259 RepID=A0A5N6SKG6_ASPPS|nr:heterokaryon incompatibility protein-domain-containing protein [Aspergillus pseudotamarii]KAE8135186.1 heterokaryon incompatibility protein-domain-containing protein [Aspergillus pseudotamarii]
MSAVTKPPVFDRETTLAAIPLLAVAAYNSVELFYWIFSFFRRYHGFYFWSLLVTAWGIIVFVTAVILSGFAGPTTRPALESFSRKYGHFVIACSCARELLLSGVYLWVAFRNLKPILDAKGQEGRRVKRELMIINIFVLVSTVCLLALDNTNHEAIKQGYGSMATSVKLKMEFAVLNKLRHGSVTDDLCFLCRRIDFEYVGFHDSPEYSSNHYFFQREFPTLLSSSKTCVFCSKLVSIITDWFAANPGDRTNGLDISRAHVVVSLETDWHTVTREHGDLAEEKAHSDRIRVTCSIPWLGADNETEQPQHLTFFLQRYEGPSDDTIQNADSKVGISPKLQPYTGRQRPLVADLALFKRWKETCQEIHGAKCSQIFKGTPNIRPRVIDVERRCLTLAEENDQWTLRLLKENIQAFSQPGSLSPDVLPNITEDALQVTKGLGERYLWVDSLCIIQDDDQDKAKFISRMDSIYTLATVVIISSTCTDANTPLPGVKPGSRRQQQEPFKIRDVTLVQSLDPSLGVKVDLRTSRAAGYLGETIWDTRAWTLQERFLASRSLIFTGEQVFWECEEAFWCEDSFRELPNISPDPHRTSLCAGELNLSWNSDIVTFDHFYRVLLEDYSGRALSFDSDGLNAFLGIIGALERSIGETFFWGMPTAFLESALAWGHRSHALRRRHGVQTLSQAQSQFPSWSWVGWTSDGQTKLANQNLTMEALGLRFYRGSEDGSTMIEMKQNAKFNNEVDLLVEGSKLPDRSSRPHNVSMAELPTNPSISLSSLLCFWSASARLTVTSRHSAVDTSEDLDSNTWEATLSQGSDSIIQVSWSHIAPSLKPGDTVELVAVAQNRGSWDAGHIDNGAIGAMLISWDAKGGIATREGFAWIAIRDWTSLRDREWKLIVLG